MEKHSGNSKRFWSRSGCRFPRPARRATARAERVRGKQKRRTQRDHPQNKMPRRLVLFSFHPPQLELFDFPHRQKVAETRASPPTTATPGAQHRGFRTSFFHARIPWQEWQFKKCAKISWTHHFFPTFFFFFPAYTEKSRNTDVKKEDTETSRGDWH